MHCGGDACSTPGRSSPLRSRRCRHPERNSPAILPGCSATSKRCWTSGRRARRPACRRGASACGSSRRQPRTSGSSSATSPSSTPWRWKPNSSASVMRTGSPSPPWLRSGLPRPRPSDGRPSSVAGSGPRCGPRRTTAWCRSTRWSGWTGWPTSGLAWRASWRRCLPGWGPMPQASPLGSPGASRAASATRRPPSSSSSGPSRR